LAVEMSEIQDSGNLLLGWGCWDFKILSTFEYFG
jgi:hypothetical protein